MPAEWDGIICISAGLSNSHNAAEQADIEAQYEARAGSPNVIGAIDCAHSAIKAHHMMNLYINRKHFHSINVQMYVMRKWFVGVAWFNARFIHSVTELLETNYKLALWLLGEKLYLCICPNICPCDVH